MSHSVRDWGGASPTRSSRPAARSGATSPAALLGRHRGATPKVSVANGRNAKVNDTCDACDTLPQGEKKKEEGEDCRTARGDPSSGHAGPGCRNCRSAQGKTAAASFTSRGSPTTTRRSGSETPRTGDISEESATPKVSGIVPLAPPQPPSSATGRPTRAAVVFLSSTAMCARRRPRLLAGLRPRGPGTAPDVRAPAQGRRLRAPRSRGLPRPHARGPWPGRRSSGCR